MKKTVPTPKLVFNLETLQFTSTASTRLMKTFGNSLPPIVRSQIYQLVKTMREQLAHLQNWVICKGTNQTRVSYHTIRLQGRNATKKIKHGSGILSIRLAKGFEGTKQDFVIVFEWEPLKLFWATAKRTPFHPFLLICPLIRQIAGQACGWLLVITSNCCGGNPKTSSSQADACIVSLGDYPYGHDPNSKFDNVNLGYQFLEVELRLISVTINFWKFWSLMELLMDVTHSGGLSWLAMGIHRSWFRWVLP